MTGVGFSRHPEKDATNDDNQIHLWKSVGHGSSKSYCGEFEVDIGLSSKGMTQVTHSQIDSWHENDSVCEECVEALDESYSG